jgi:hypothetical protein
VDDKTVPELTGYQAIAAELRRIADDVEGLVGEPAPRMFSLNIQPFNADGIGANTAKGRPATVAAVDAVGMALLGKAGRTHRLSGGSFHHSVHGDRGPINFSIYQSVADPEVVDRDEEIALLRARVAELEAGR